MLKELDRHTRYAFLEQEGSFAFKRYREIWECTNKLRAMSYRVSKIMFYLLHLINK